MKKVIVLTFMFLCILNSAVAQDGTHSVSVELLGAQNTIGINYDTRLNGNCGWGYRIGIGYGYGSSSGLFDQCIHGIAIPLELNYLLGKSNSKLELGVGTSLGIYHVEETVFTFPSDTEWEQQAVTDNRFGYFLFGNIGYRIQRKQGFMFRIGITPSLNFGDKHGIDRANIFPYLGLGLSF